MSHRQALGRRRPRSDRRSRSGRTGRRERGAILVEFVIVIPLFMTLVIGIFEIGKAWEANQTVVQASRSGARTVTQMGTDSRADHQGLLAVVSTFGADAGDVVSVTIFEADEDGNADPACAANGTCNVYTRVQLDDIGSPNLFFNVDGTGDGTSCGSTDYSDNWCPTARNNSQRDATYVGVTVVFEEQFQTGFFGDATYEITETAVMRIEPDAD